MTSKITDIKRLQTVRAFDFAGFVRGLKLVKR